MRTTAAAILVAVALVVPGLAQSLTGKWLGDTPDGGAIGLDLTVTGSTLTGTFVAMRGGQSVPIPTDEGTLTGKAFTIQVVAGNDRATFAGEYSGDRITLRTVSPDPSGSPIVLTRVDAFPETTVSPLATTAPASAPAGWRAHNRAATLVAEDGRQIVRVDARLGDGVIWQEGADVTDGTIELEIRGANRPGQSFVGVAFRGADNATFDAIYFRPFNFRAGEPGRQRAVQYISQPDYPWAKLRKEHPGQYESAISPVPEPDGWFRARIVIEGQTIRTFVDDTPTPTLTVRAMTQSRGGMVGFWVGNGSGGDFANLRVTPK